MISRKTRIRELQKNPERLLVAPAVSSKDQISSNPLQDEDLYIYAFLYALVTPSLRTLIQAIRANQPVFLVYTPPSKWSRPGQRSTLGRLVLISNTNEPNSITLEGQDTDRKFQTEQITLTPGSKTITACEFYSLNSLHTQGLPRGMVKVHSPIINETIQIRTIEWRNLWVYGMQITLVGYITRGEFRKRSHCSQAADHIHPDAGLDPICQPLLVSDLHPLQDLFARAKSWHRC